MVRTPAPWRYALKRSIFVIALLSGLFCSFAAQAGGSWAHDAGLIDQTPNILKLGSDVEKGRGPDSLDAEKPFIRFAGKGARARFKLNCHPEKQNYLTVKVWGGSGSSGSKLTLNDAGLLLHQRTASPFPGRFYYATQSIPRQRTEGKSKVTVTLQAKGGQPGPDVYNVYTHTGAFFRPPAGELQGEPFKLGPPRPSDESDKEVPAEEVFESWKNLANKLIDDVRKYQMYGNGPDWVHGAINAWGGSPSGAYKKLDSEIERWGGYLMRGTLGNMGALRYLLAFAKAYKTEWCDYYQDEEMLKRIVAAMDFYCRAQGKNGGFLGPPIPGKSNVNWPTWLGGPERSSGHHGLEVGQRYLYLSFYMLLPEIQDTGVLDKPFDHDLNPDTEKIPRRRAYAEMARRSFSKMVRNVKNRNVANQCMHNFDTLYQTYEVIKVMDPEMAKQEKDRIIRLARIASGVVRQPGADHYIISPAGLGNECRYDAGSGYGAANPGQLAGIAQKTDLGFVKERVHKLFRGYSHFLYLTNDNDGYRQLNNVGWISSRARKGIPGGSKVYLANGYAAKELEVPAAIRAFELRKEHNPSRKRSLADWEWGDEINRITLCKYVNRAINRAERHREEMKKGQPEALPSTDYRLATEREEDSAYADWHLQAVTLRHGDATLFLECWTGHKVRLRYRTPAFERLAHVPYFENSGPKRRGKYSRGRMLNTIRYGPYFIVLNGSEEKSFEYEVAEDFKGKKATELQSGRTGILGRNPEIPPMSSYVFVCEQDRHPPD